MSFRILIVTTVSEFLWQFEQDNIRILQQMGAEIHYASNFDAPDFAIGENYFEKNGIITHPLPICRSPWRLRENARALKMLAELIETCEIDVIHCHTPVGALLGRLAGRLAKRRVKVIYTVHGFHFYQGAPVKNWLLYYQAERFLARFTDTLVTINEEDTRAAGRFRMKKGGVVRQIPGVGLDLKRYGFRPHMRREARRRLGLGEGQLGLLTAARLDQDKNYQTVLDALAQLDNVDFQYFICGEGPYRQVLEAQIKRLKLQGRVRFLGYRKDLEVLHQGIDIFLFPSVREGLGMAPLEAMACRRPVIGADNRGTREYLRHGENGLLCAGEDSEEFARAIRLLAEDAGLRQRLGERGAADVFRFSVHRTGEIMRQVYQEAQPLPVERREGLLLMREEKENGHEQVCENQCDYECV